MDSPRSERVCRYFINGGCRLGSRCKYRHERPLSMQLCRYFQKGGCWYGESCRYLHVLQPDGAAATGRRCSAPAVSSSVTPTAPDRRGSQPAVLQAGMTPGQETRQPQSVAVHISNQQGDAGPQAEKQSQDSESPLGTDLPLEQNSKVPQETVASNAAEKDNGAAASSGSREYAPVTCGICMDNVYEKKPRDNVFGILPNCNHAFCKRCITTWRKMREYGPDVVKSCPQCRVKSAFYVPSEHWVEGQEKENLIAAFRQRCSKKNCHYYTRYRCCPFETECLYLHDKRARWMSPCPTEDNDDYVVDPLNLLLALTLLGGDTDDDDEEDSLDFPFYLFHCRHKVVAASTLGKEFTRKEEINSWRDAKQDINMEISKYLTKFDGQSKLLIRSLVCGPFDAQKALKVFQRQHRYNPGLLLNLLKILCREEVASTQTKTQPLTIKPLVCLFPTLFKQNLLTFISLVHQLLPQTAIKDLLVCLSHDSQRSPWVTALMRQLERNIGIHSEEPLCTSSCSQRLQQLSQQFAGPDGTRGWADCFSGHVKDSGTHSSQQGTQKKRKSSQISLGSDAEETEQQSKRPKADICSNECIDAAEQSMKEELSEKLESIVQSQGTEKSIQQATDSESHFIALPQHIKNSILQIKEVLESETDWDQSSVDVFKVLNECDPIQVEMVCNLLSLTDLNEQTLPKLCSSVLTSSHDLSYVTATTFIKSLLLQKVMSLSEPASRCLVTAATSLCSCYPRPMCQAVFLPVLEENNIGNPHSELLNRLIENCLDSHYRLLVLQMTFKIAWNEAVLSIIHCVLDSKPDMSEELFTQFTEQLLSQGPRFTKSVKFAKMMLTVITKYSTSVTTHQQSLQSCVMLNETFLKKSLQAAFKKITKS